MTNQMEKATAFKALHEADAPFIIPNPWDAGSAVLLEQAGFRALATTSSGFANSIGRKDGEVTLEEKLEHCRLLSSVTSIPINADFENGFADAPEETARNLTMLAETGVAGASIEDYSRTEIYDFSLAVERIAACAEAVSNLNFPFQLTARAEGLLRNVGDIDDAIKRLQAFESAGAHVLYAPGLKSIEQVAMVVNAVSRPVNVLAPFMPNTTLAEYGKAGAHRISIGGALAHHANKTTREAADQMLHNGRFDGM